MKTRALFLFFVALLTSVGWAQESAGEIEDALPKESESGEEGVDLPGEEDSDEPRLLTKEELKKIMLPPLPLWSPADFEKVKKGEIVAGKALLVATPVDPNAKIEEPVVEEPLPKPEEVPEPEIDETAISPEFLVEYFKEVPKDDDGHPVFLVDPQELLARQEFRDRESFLQYHSSESNINMHVYLFDGRQQLPEGMTIKSVYRDLYADRGPVSVVFYHLGMPDRSQIVLSSDIRAVISEDEQNRALRAAVQEAFEKSDVAYQLDNFLVELSIRLYWIERELNKAETPRLARMETDEKVLAAARSEDDNFRLVARAFLFVFYMVVVGLLGWLGYFFVERRMKVHFPEVECGPLLGAPHAAGVGAVISFSSSQLPPSQQRDQVPDYLQRM